jgi:molybdate transport system ATP-binding protein
MSLTLRNIRVSLANFNLEVEAILRGRITVVFGPSGAGKTSLLDVVAGLRRPESGFIQLKERVLNDPAKSIFVPPNHRNIGYVPQDLALFPHLSVRQNLLYGHKSSGGKSLFSFDHVADVLEIQSLIGRGVADLSGGEKQRVALARALLTSPRLLLLDEPLASLDLKLRMRIIPFLVRIRDEFGIPMLYVTHDRFETLALADEMLVLVEGKVAQAGSVQQLFSHPANLAVAGLLTVETIQQGTIERIENGLTIVTVGSATLTAVSQQPDPEGRDVYVCIRAEDVILLKGHDTPSSARNHLAALVQSVTREGPLARVELDCGFALSALLTKQACEEMELKPGDRAVALIKAPHIHLIPR